MPGCDICGAPPCSLRWTRGSTTRLCPDHAETLPEVRPPMDADELWYALNEGWVR
jgi:hypothetical protein